MKVRSMVVLTGLGVIGLVLLLLAWANPVHLGVNNVSLAAGETLRGHLLVLGHNVELAPGARLTGHLCVVGGNATVEGAVDGHVLLVAANGIFAPAAIGGELYTIESSVLRH